MGESALLKIAYGKNKTTMSQANIKKVTKCFFCIDQYEPNTLYKLKNIKQIGFIDLFSLLWDCTGLLVNDNDIHIDWRFFTNLHMYF